MPGTSKGRRVALLSGAALLVVLAVVGWLNRAELRTWYSLWRDFESLGANAQGYPEYRHRRTGIIFVSLPGGEFWMGAQSEDPSGTNCDPDAHEDEGPVHKVTLSPFLIAKFELTQGEWEQVMGDNPSEFKSATLPVEKVTWNDCKEFSRKTGLSLPSEAQWEYACRAGTAGPYAGTGKLRDMGWYDDNRFQATHPVGHKQSNEFGLDDMHGNVWEWCKDVYDEDFYSKPEASQKDPVCTTGSEFRVVRGGSWLNVARVCRSACRRGGLPSGRYNIIGFRPAVPLR